MMVWKCPVCEKGLIKDDRVFKCSNGHRFDIAKQGYINLLQSQVSKMKQHGDEKEMVQARQEFLELGHYEAFRTTLSELVTLELQAVVVDAGCGEGYYAKDFVMNHSVYGIDISKDAISKAARRHKEMECAVASTFAFPFMSESADLVYSVFAPFSIDEVRRVLKLGGYFVDTFPLENHLLQLKEVLYTNPYKNIEEINAYEGFECIEVRRIEQIAHLMSAKDILNLFKMTPYYHRTPEVGVVALSKLETLDTEIGFGFAVYKKL